MLKFEADTQTFIQLPHNGSQFSMVKDKKQISGIVITSPQVKYTMGYKGLKVKKKIGNVPIKSHFRQVYALSNQFKWL